MASRHNKGDSGSIKGVGNRPVTDITEKLNKKDYDYLENLCDKQDDEGLKETKTLLNEGIMSEEERPQWKQLGARVSMELYQRFKHQAVDENISIGALVEKAMQEYLAKYEKSQGDSTDAKTTR